MNKRSSSCKVGNMLVPSTRTGWYRNTMMNADTPMETSTSLIHEDVHGRNPPLVGGLASNSSALKRVALPRKMSLSFSGTATLSPVLHRKKLHLGSIYLPVAVRSKSDVCLRAISSQVVLDLRLSTEFSTGVLPSALKRAVPLPHYCLPDMQSPSFPRRTNRGAP